MTKPLLHETEPGWGFLTSPRWLGYYALIIIFSIVCVLLGNWQFERRDEARAEISRLDLNYDASPVELTEILATKTSFDIDTDKWRPVKIKGVYTENPLLVRNRIGAGGVGSILLHPLVLEDGSYFFVDRGWVDVNAADSVTAALPVPATGEVEVTARLRPGESRIAGKEAVNNTLGSIDLEIASEMLEAESYTSAYGQLITESPSGETGILPPKPERDEGPHLSYALQWYVFILIVIVGAWYAATLEHKSLNSSPTQKHRERLKSKNSRRKLTDAEQEDAYLDSQH